MELKSCVKFNIGIDVGGTNTDCVLYDYIGRRILSSVKLPTVHSSYANAIEGVLSALTRSLGSGISEAASLNISTTVSTNALLEGKGEPSNLILIGFNRYPHIVADIEDVVEPLSLLKISGGHTGWGKEREPLDISAVENFVKDRRGELFTVSSLYSPRNPEHETAVKKILISGGSGHVSCSHELSYSRLNSVKRTVTAYLNTSLVPLTERLIDDILSVTKKYGLSCPVMFLRSDSTLVPAEWCRRFPIEMIYSGPAASLRGAASLAVGEDFEDFIAADIGGTSTDIGRVHKGRPAFSEEGAKIGSYKTMIPSLDVLSIALGGDSGVEIRGTDDIKIGPVRFVPLCMEEENRTISSGRYPRCNSENDLYGPRPSQNIDAPVSSQQDLSWEEMSRPKRRTESRYSYTLTDAFNTLGLSRVGDTKKSKAASLHMGGKVPAAGTDIALKVGLKANRILESSIVEYTSKCGVLPRLYVGMPGKVFAKLGGMEGQKIIVPEEGPVAGALGAAASSVELSCRSFIMHSFADEKFTAFLPESTKSSDDFQMLLEEAERDVTIYLGTLAGKMGYPEARIVIDKKFSYAGDKKNISALLSLSIECRAFVNNAQ